ncbi:VOC family protein [Natribaculum luteum]|uniref:VOC family protein n=1 Tax=Natribaculum luteum TaxID=1586232 RepID=A0ABD5NXF6_9EURY|nr:VOC family protein [Natribaculum luteum]
MTELTAHHVGVTVTDLEEVLAFYRDVLGFDVLDRFTVSGEAFADGVGVVGATGRFAHLDGGSVRVELVEYDPEGSNCTADAINQPGAKHVGFVVDDVAAFYDGLPADVETLSEPRTTESGTTILFLRDPEGNLVEVLET